MAKSREKLQQLGLWDEEVSRPSHDSICLWCYQNAEVIARTVYAGEYDRQWTEAEFPSPDVKLGLVEAKERFLASTARENPRVVSRLWEVPLTVRTGYKDSIERIIGYADLTIHLEAPLLTVEYSGCRPNERVAEFSWFWHKARVPPILVEVKDKLPTFGQLMRQMNLYRTSHKGPLVVVSSDDSYKELLRDQDVNFVKYQE